jgi:hypothetical protein
VFYVGLRMLSGRKLIRHDEPLKQEALAASKTDPFPL